MRRGAAGAESRSQENGLDNFFLAGAGFLRGLRMNFDAIDALR